MMNREEFVEKHLDEMVGLLVAAMGQRDLSSHKISDDSFAADGKFIMQQMRRARNLLVRMYDDLNPQPFKGTTNGTPTVNAKKNVNP